jgi:hypothetical protein
MDKKLDLSKPIQTRDGRRARILANDLKGTRPLVAAISTSDSSPNEGVYTYLEDGRYLTSDPHHFDLVNVPVKKEGWTVVRPYPIGYDGSHAYATWLFDTKTEAEKHQGKFGEGVVVKVEWEE